MTRPSLAFAAALLLALCPMASAAQLRVDAGRPIKLVDHAASGALYGIAGPGWPPDSFIAAIAPKNFTQMAPGGGQLPNGEAAPVGDALLVAPIAARQGASVTIRMPDMFPSFPYVWRGQQNWDDAVAKMVRATVAANPPNIYAYEIWNEPDWDWQPGWGDFDAMWTTAYRAIRAIDPDRPIMGPSAAKWDAGWMRRFLTAAIASGTVPGVVSWHELDPATEADAEGHVAAYRALERELGIGPLPISINEYGAPRDSAVPGTLAGDVARLERAGVDTADLAFWHRPGRLADLLVPKAGGTGPATDPEPTGAYWLYRWYGDMHGQMLAVTGSNGLDGFASLDGTTLRLVLGGAAGAQDVTIDGLAAFGDRVTAQIYATHWTGTDGTLAAPDALFATPLPLEAGTAHFTIPDAKPSDAFLVVVTPADKAAPFVPTPKRWSQHLEAEDAVMAGARKFTIAMEPSNFFANTLSGAAYVGLLDRQTVSLQFVVDAPEAGRYELSFGYSNGLAAPAHYRLAIGDTPPTDIVFTPTQGRELIGRMKQIVDLPAGMSPVTLSNGANSPRGALLPSLIEIDDLTVTALPPAKK